MNILNFLGIILMKTEKYSIVIEELVNNFTHNSSFWQCIYYILEDEVYNKLILHQAVENPIILRNILLTLIKDNE